MPDMRHVIFLNGIWTGKTNTLQGSFTRSISCYQLKHWLSHFSFKSQVIDFCQLLSTDEIIDQVDTFISKETIAVGISTTFWPADNSIPPSLREAIPRIRDKWPHLKIIAGGARKNPNTHLFDEVFIGESEDKFVAWCQAHVGKSSLLNRKFNITSLDHRFTEEDAILDGEALPIELGRGCIFKCKFCAHQNLGKPKFTYQRDFGKILSEIEYNYEKFGTTKYMLLDDTVNEDLDKVRNLSTIRDVTGVDFEWTGYLRADLVWAKQESVDLLPKSGLKSCFFGIETFHPPAGKSIDKGWGAKHGKEYLPKLFADLWKSEINIHVNLIAGLPYETLETLNESLEWCMSNPIGHHRFAPLTLYVEKDDESASSEFTRNYKDYGYTEVDKNGFWNSGSMTCNEAAQFSHVANLRLNKIGKISSWDVFNMTNLGYSTDFVMSLTYTEMRRIILQNKDNFKDRYITKLRNINV